MEMGDTDSRMGLTSGGSGGVGNNKLIVALVIIAIVLASVAFIVALISITQKGDVSNITVGSSVQDVSRTTGNNKIWTFAMGHFMHSDVYIDNPSGQLKGFHVDIINAVCRIANKDCRLMYDIIQRCWDSKAGEVPRGGVGLIGGWYDACAGWTKTKARARTFQFSNGWNKPTAFYFVVKAGNPNNFNPKDVTGVKFGFVDGFTNDEFCLGRQTDIRGSSLPSEQIVHYPSIDAVFDALTSGEVTATISYANPPSGLMAMNTDSMDCSFDASGRGLMLRMDNTLLEWWDPALDRLMQTSEYRRICENVKQEHDHWFDDPVPTFALMEMIRSAIDLSDAASYRQTFPPVLDSLGLKQNNRGFDCQDQPTCSQSTEDWKLHASLSGNPWIIKVGQGINWSLLRECWYYSIMASI